MISVGSLTELLGKINTLKFRDGEDGLHMNLRKGKILVFGIIMGLTNKSGMDSYSVLQTGVSSRAIFCGGSLCW